jgi:hypothetical protein
MADNLIAIQDGSPATCGAIVWWTLGGKVARDRLVAALAAEQSSAVPPEETSRIVALHAACVEVARKHGYHVHTVGRGAWAIVRSPDLDAAARALHYAVEGAARIGLTSGIDVDPGFLAGEITDAYEIARGELSAAQVSGWLCSKLEGLGALPLRERGGIYFVPSDVAGKWSKLMRAVDASRAGKIHTVPAMRSEEAVEAILSALEAEVSGAIAALDTELASDELGPRALATREREALAMLDKIDRYGKLLGTNLDSLRSQATRAKGSIASAILLADQASDQAAQ